MSEEVCGSKDVTERREGKERPMKGDVAMKTDCEGRKRKVGEGFCIHKNMTA